MKHSTARCFQSYEAGVRTAGGAVTKRLGSRSLLTAPPSEDHLNSQTQRFARVLVLGGHVRVHKTNCPVSCVRYASFGWMEDKNAPFETTGWGQLPPCCIFRAVSAAY